MKLSNPFLTWLAKLHIWPIPVSLVLQKLHLTAILCLSSCDLVSSSHPYHSATSHPGHPLSVESSTSPFCTLESGPVSSSFSLQHTTSSASLQPIPIAMASGPAVSSAMASGLGHHAPTTSLWPNVMNETRPFVVVDTRLLPTKLSISSPQLSPRILPLICL